MHGGMPPGNYLGRHGGAGVDRVTVAPSLPGPDAAMTMNASATPMPQRLLLLVLAGGSLGNGALMMLAPAPWYGCIVNPQRAALFNAHFVADAGAAYLSVGAALLWAALRPLYAWPLVAIALLFSALHGAAHVYEYTSFGMPTRGWLIEGIGIWAPLLLLGGIALRLRAASRQG
jgi:hypothetical protein